MLTNQQKMHGAGGTEGEGEAHMIFGTLFLKQFDSTVCYKATKQNNQGHHNTMDLIAYALPV